MTEIAKHLFQSICERLGLPVPVPEYAFAAHLGRRWKFDWAWPGVFDGGGGLALEIEGGVWKSGRHNRASGFVKDLAKYNCAAVLGWRLLRCLPAEFASGAILETVREALGGES